jgi:hypothetical protein
VQSWVIPEPGRGPQFPTRLTYTVHDGLVTSFQSIPGTPAARPGILRHRRLDAGAVTTASRHAMTGFHRSASPR